MKVEKMQQKNCLKGKYYILNRQELLGFFFKKEELIQFYVDAVRKTTVTIVTDLII